MTNNAFFKYFRKQENLLFQGYYVLNLNGHLCLLKRKKEIFIQDFIQKQIII